MMSAGCFACMPTLLCGVLDGGAGVLQISNQFPEMNEHGLAAFSRDLGDSLVQ